MNLKAIGNKIKGTPTMTEGTVYSMLIICSISHFLNDMIQSIIPSIYPIIKDEYGFTFAQIGIITLIFQMTSSILQPFTGLYADKHPRPYALSVCICFKLIGLVLLAFAENYLLILLAVSIVGLGSSVFHPTASRVAQMASGGKKSLAQSIFQVGGNGGAAIGPLLAAIIILPFGQHAISWFAIAALIAALIMIRLGAWYKARLAYVVNHPQKQPLLNHDISKAAKYGALLILVFAYANGANVNYTALYYANRQTENYLNAMVVQVRMTEGFDTEKEWAFIGSIDDPLMYNSWQEEDVYGGNNAAVDLINKYSRNWWIRYSFGYSIPQASEEKTQQLAQMQEVKAMPCWPDEGSIKVIGDTVVIKFQNTTDAS